jgi:hypothetical protein
MSRTRASFPLLAGFLAASLFFAGCNGLSEWSAERASPSYDYCNDYVLPQDRQSDDLRERAFEACEAGYFFARSFDPDPDQSYHRTFLEVCGECFGSLDPAACRRNFAEYRLPEDSLRALAQERARQPIEDEARRRGLPADWIDHPTDEESEIISANEDAAMGAIQEVLQAACVYGGDRYVNHQQF